MGYVSVRMMVYSFRMALARRYGASKFKARHAKKCGLLATGVVGQSQEMGNRIGSGVGKSQWQLNDALRQKC